MRCGISSDLPQVVNFEGSVKQETHSLRSICLPKIQLKYVRIGREDDQNWEGISENGTVSEMWGLKGGNPVAFYNAPPTENWKPGDLRQ